MKLARIFLAVALAGIPTAVHSAAPVEPDFSNVFFRLLDGKLIPLERQTASVHIKGGMISGFSGFGEVAGPHSPVRFSHAESLQFVVKPLNNENHDPNQDPDATYHLRTLKSKRKSREWMFSKLTASRYRLDIAEGVLPVKWAKFGSGSLLMSAGPLPVGEYCASPLVQEVAELRVLTIFCFGVD